ncbi:putative ecotropic viral integration site 5 protein [Paratrimastix pyriformis]|uniref:Ecotropic viral integration site 5 protein n=1 Tax=Paratrimastix pyriformis TaxID=342808 RepID=A0ABQ8UN76_9EUKA|nr:putative ecotropic viral integration site 5 protein [Paratrimastix pyriformis]
MRGLIWQKALDSSSMMARFPAIFQRSLDEVSLDDANRIDRDLKRTFPTDPYFTNPRCRGYQQLRRVLLAYAGMNKVGYCQGMNFVAGTLLLFMQEEEAFWAFVQLMESPQFMLKGLYDKDSSDLPRYLHLVDAYLARHCPALARHFVRSLPGAPSTRAVP